MCSILLMHFILLDTRMHVHAGLALFPGPTGGARWRWLPQCLAPPVAPWNKPNKATRLCWWICQGPCDVNKIYVLQVVHHLCNCYLHYIVVCIFLILSENVKTSWEGLCLLLLRFIIELMTWHPFLFPISSNHCSIANFHKFIRNLHSPKSSSSPLNCVHCIYCL